MKKCSLIIIIIAFLIITISCDKETTEPGVQNVVVSENTEVIDSEIADEEIESISENGEFTVDVSGGLADLEVGNVLLGGISQLAPEGFLRKVTNKRT